MLKDQPLEEKLVWIFRIAIAGEFIGHGAFGVITKAAWVPYFSVVGINEQFAYQLMPWVGTVDILLGVLTLFSPLRAILLYMSVWGLWTASLRPLSGDSIWETVERAGNYGVPLTFLLLSGGGRFIKDWFSKIHWETLRPQSIEHLALLLRLTTGLLLFGHGALLALTHKDTLLQQLIAMGIPSRSLQPEYFAQFIGWFEIALALMVTMKPMPKLLVFVVIWKVVTELLYPLSGAPIWEFVERGGSYAAPLALYFIETWQAPSEAENQTMQKTVRIPPLRRTTFVPAGR